MPTFRQALGAAAAVAALTTTPLGAHAQSVIPTLPPLGAPLPAPPLLGALLPALAPQPLGSPLPAPAPLQLLGAAQASQPVEFDIVLPLSNSAALDQLLTQLTDPTSSQYHKWLTPSAFASRFGPSPLLSNLVALQLRIYGLTVTSQTRSLHVRGTAAQVNAAFGANLQVAADAIGRLRLVAGNALTLPGSLGNTGLLIPAFNAGKSDANPLVRRAASGYARRSTGGYARRSTAGYGSQANGNSIYLFNNLKQAYAYPSYQTKSGLAHLDGTGATVAVIMSSNVQDSDVAAMFDSDGFTTASGQAADPAIFARRPVNGGPNAAADATSGEEATLDVEQVLGGAPGSHVVLYDTPDLSDQSQVSALVAVDNDNAADVVSMS